MPLGSPPNHLLRPNIPIVHELGDHFGPCRLSRLSAAELLEHPSSTALNWKGATDGLLWLASKQKWMRMVLNVFAHQIRPRSVLRFGKHSGRRRLACALPLHQRRFPQMLGTQTSVPLPFRISPQSRAVFQGLREWLQ